MSRRSVNARLRENMSLEQRLTPSKIAASAVTESSSIQDDEEMELDQGAGAAQGRRNRLTFINTGSTPLPPLMNPNPPRFGPPITHNSQDFGVDVETADQKPR